MKAEVQTRADPLPVVDDRIVLLGGPHGNIPKDRDELYRFLAVGTRQFHVLGDFGFIGHGGPREH